MPIRPAIACAALLALLGGCGGYKPGQWWDKPGATQAEFQRDEAGCYVQASERFQPLRQAPAPQVNMQVGQPRGGIRFNDGSDMPAAAGAFDQNRTAREAAFRVCMMDRGWTAIAAPRR